MSSLPRMVRLASALACTLVPICVSGCGGDNPPTAGLSGSAGIGSALRATHLVTKETILYDFGGPGGAGPNFGMIPDGAGGFYGTTLFGGTAGIVFRLKPQGSGYAESVIHHFRGVNDGEIPEGVVLGSDAALYGVTFAGGGSGNGGAGWGTVFKLTPGPTNYPETQLYAFKGYPDAGAPNGPIVMDKGGALYGSSGTGGINNTGAVFRVAPNGSGYNESVIYSFPAYGTSGGQQPQSGLAIDSRGNVFGTTAYGGSFQGTCGYLGGCGVVFEVSSTKSGFSERVIHAFNDTDGDEPQGVPTIDQHTGAIYGTTSYGGSTHVGSVYQLVPKGSGYTASLLYSFTGHGDGLLPQGAILVKRDGALYGTTDFGGGGCGARGYEKIGCGTVFELVPSHGGYSFKSIFRFANSLRGAEPEQANLLTDAGGALFGTTRSGGNATSCTDGGPGGVKGCGVVFKIATTDR